MSDGSQIGRVELDLLTKISELSASFLPIHLYDLLMIFYYTIKFKAKKVEIITVECWDRGMRIYGKAIFSKVRLLS